jgi:hypothetical protein
MAQQKTNILSRQTLVPLGAVFAIGSTFFGGVAWLTTINLKVAQLQADVTELQSFTTNFGERITRVEEKQDSQTAILEEVRLDVKSLLKASSSS